MKAPNTILVVVTRRIGDVLLSTPLIRSMRRTWPDSHIDVLVFENTQGFLISNTDIRQIITVPEKLGLWKHLKFLLTLIRRYDLAISTLPGDRPTFYAWLSGKRRVGMLENHRKQRWKTLLLNSWTPFDNCDLHTVLMNIKLAYLLSIDPICEVVVSWRQSDEDHVKRELPFNIRSEHFALLHIYPKFSYKMWHQDGWVKLVQWLDSRGIRTVLSGSEEPKELAYVNHVFSLLPSSAVNASGNLSLSEVAFIASHAHVYVGPDTAITHMAAALGVPTIALYGPTNPVKWGPWPRHHTCHCNPYVMRGSQTVGNVVLLQGEGHCVPCQEEGCDRNINSLSDCLQNLPVTKVIEAVQMAVDLGVK